MKFFCLLLLCYLLLIVQISFVPEAIVTGSRPNLILLILCFGLFWHRDTKIFLWAIIVGLICETFDSSIPGMGILLLTCLSWIAYRIQTHFEIRSLLSRFILIAVTAFLFDGFFQVLNQWDAKVLSDLSTLAQQSAGNALYTAVVGAGLLMAFNTIWRLIPVGLQQNLGNKTVYNSRFTH